MPASQGHPASMTERRDERGRPVPASPSVPVPAPATEPEAIARALRALLPRE